MEIEITIPEPLADMLFHQAAVEEIPLEKIIIRAIRNFIEKEGEENVC